MQRFLKELDFMEGLRSHILELSKTVRIFIKDKTNERLILPDLETFYQTSWEKFTYSEKGIDVGRGESKYMSIPSWSRATARIYLRIKDTSAYNELLKKLKEVQFGTFNAEMTVQKLAMKFAEVYLSDIDQNTEANIEALCQKVIQQIATQELNAVATIYLIGITLQSEEIELMPGIRLRRSNQADISQSIPMHQNIEIADSPFATAVLEIKRMLTIKQWSGLTNEIEKTIHILRLLGVGAIYYKYYTVQTDWLLNGINDSEVIPSNFPHPPVIFFLEKRNESLVKAMFAYMQTHLPHLSGINRKINSLTVSYDRYEDACNEGKIFERKVMNAIMGLEALYLDDNMELSYKLSIRCAKVMSFCNLDPLEIKRVIKVGYKIRSVFAHGDHLKKKDINKYNDQFGDYQNIGNQLCNYLRVSICVNIILKLKKSPFLEELDNSLLSLSISEKLKKDFLILDQYLLH